MTLRGSDAILITYNLPKPSGVEGWLEDINPFRSFSLNPSTYTAIKNALSTRGVLVHSTPGYYALSNIVVMAYAVEVRLYADFGSKDFDEVETQIGDLLRQGGYNWTNYTARISKTLVQDVTDAGHAVVEDLGEAFRYAEFAAIAIGLYWLYKTYKGS